MVPLQLQTGDAAFDAALSSSTYKVEGLDTNGDAEVNVGPGEKKELTFVLEDSNGTQVRKRITFDAERYATDFSVSVKRGDQALPHQRRHGVGRFAGIPRTREARPHPQTVRVGQCRLPHLDGGRREGCL